MMLTSIIVRIPIRASTSGSCCPGMQKQQKPVYVLASVWDFKTTSEPSLTTICLSLEKEIYAKAYGNHLLSPPFTVPIAIPNVPIYMHDSC